MFYHALYPQLKALNRCYILNLKHPRPKRGGIRRGKGGHKASPWPWNLAEKLIEIKRSDLPAWLPDKPHRCPAMTLTQEIWISERTRRELFRLSYALLMLLYFLFFHCIPRSPLQAQSSRAALPEHLETWGDHHPRPGQDHVEPKPL